MIATIASVRNVRREPEPEPQPPQPPEPGPPVPQPDPQPQPIPQPPPDPSPPPPTGGRSQVNAGKAGLRSMLPWVPHDRGPRYRSSSQAERGGAG